MPSFLILAACAGVVLLALLRAWSPIWGFFDDQAGWLPWVVVAVAALVPLAVLSWYSMTWAEVRRSAFTVRTLTGSRRVDLRRLDSVHVFARTPSERGSKKHQLLLQLRDSQGGEAWLPLNVWRDEDLLMARVLRATVERRVQIEGDPKLVRRFSGLLVTYRSWDRQQAAA